MRKAYSKSFLLKENKKRKYIYLAANKKTNLISGWVWKNHMLNYISMKSVYSFLWKSTGENMRVLALLIHSSLSKNSYYFYSIMLDVKSKGGTNSIKVHIIKYNKLCVKKIHCFYIRLIYKRGWLYEMQNKINWKGNPSKWSWI